MRNGRVRLAEVEALLAMKHARSRSSTAVGLRTFIVVLAAGLGVAITIPVFAADAAPNADIDPGAIKNLDAAYPKAPDGMERKVVLLPHVERGADEAQQVEILVGRVIETDGINSYRFGGTIEERNIEGWGFSYFEVQGKLEQAASTLIGGPTDPAQRFVPGPRRLIRYNSRLPLVVMVPAGCELRWRIWKAADGWETAADR